MNALSRSVLIVAALGGLGLALTLGCKSGKEPSSADANSARLTTAATNDPQANRKAPEYEVREAKTLFHDATSAYSARVFSGSKETLVITPTNFFRIGPDEKIAKYQANIGHLSTRLEDSIVFWRDASLHSLSLDSLKERELIRLARQPQALLTDGPRLAWLMEDESGVYSLQTLSAGSAHFLYASKNHLSVPALHDETVYFVERTDKGWKLGRVPLDGSEVSFGSEHSTRTPSMLAAGHDGVYFYDGIKGGVRKATFDLRFEEPVQEEAICSPLAVSNRVVCAQVGGLIDIPQAGADPRIVAGEPGGPIADLSVNDTSAVWIADSGENRMTVRTVPLPAL